MNKEQQTTRIVLQSQTNMDPYFTNKVNVFNMMWS